MWSLPVVHSNSLPAPVPGKTAVGLGFGFGFTVVATVALAPAPAPVPPVPPQVSVFSVIKGSRDDEVKGVSRAGDGVLRPRRSDSSVQQDGERAASGAEGDGRGDSELHEAALAGRVQRGSAGRVDGEDDDEQGAFERGHDSGQPVAGVRGVEGELGDGHQRGGRACDEGGGVRVRAPGDGGSAGVAATCEQREGKLNKS
eukprot:466198-Prorocentrum_minimum.AAC.32